MTNNPTSPQGKHKPSCLTRRSGLRAVSINRCHGTGAPAVEDGICIELQAVLLKARRARRRNQTRREIVVLRQACAIWEHRPGLWVLLAAACLRARQQADAVEALGTALWLWQRAGKGMRAEVVRKLIERAKLTGRLVAGCPTNCSAA